MGKQHSPRERLQLFGIGFRRGAGMKALPKNVQSDLDVIEGEAAGRKAYGEAMEIARLKYGAPKPSILRDEVVLRHRENVIDVPHEVTPTALEELSRDPRTAAGNKGGPDHRGDE